MKFEIAIPSFAVLTAVLSTSLYAAAPEPAETVIPLEKLSAACRAAEFRPLNPADIQNAKTELTDAIERLDRRLAQHGANGQAWAKYLRLGELQDQLRGDKQPDRAALKRIFGRYNADHEGLELVWFLDVEHALHNYIAMLGAVGNPEIRTRFENSMKGLAAEPGRLCDQADNRRGTGHRRRGALPAGRAPGAGVGPSHRVALCPPELVCQGFARHRGGGH